MDSARVAMLQNRPMTGFWRAKIDAGGHRIEAFGATDNEAWQRVSTRLFEIDAEYAPDLLCKIETEHLGPSGERRSV